MTERKTAVGVGEGLGAYLCHSAAKEGRNPFRPEQGHQLIKGIHIAKQCNASSGVKEHDILPFGKESITNMID